MLVVIAIIAILVGILLPAIGRARDAALVTQSQGNLRNLASANASYQAEWNGRQFTASPDDAGLYGSCGNYIANAVCPPQQILGWDQNGAIWGYYLGCDGYPGSCGNWDIYMPMNFDAPSGGSPYPQFGSFRLPNVKAFTNYVNFKYYDEVFWAPKDEILLEKAEPFFQNPSEFYSDGTEITFSSYCWSPAAMFAPDVFSSAACASGSAGNYWLPSGTRSPSVGMCTYPDLKTQMLEHNWLQFAEADVNPAFIGGETPYYFNAGYSSTPVALFFDGHVGAQSCADAMEADARASNQGNACGLWCRGTPLGNNGYYGQYAYDFLVDTSFHILTCNGIQGRDTIGMK
ncbi:MAG: hypothetical protein CMJ32_03700 [Phycisphaerae bacterium]|nr:hypothetical protein [Phycisphaerae bacterium]